MSHDKPYLDIRLLDLELMATLAEYQMSESSSPFSDAMAEMGVSKDVARAARSRLEQGFGRLFFRSERGTSMVPDDRGQCFAGSYVLFQHLVIRLMQEGVDHSAFAEMVHRLISSVVEEMPEKPSPADPGSAQL